MSMQFMESKGVTVNNVKFETIAPLYRIEASKLFPSLRFLFELADLHLYSHPQPNIQIRFGLRITNQSENYLRFDLEQSLLPEIILEGGVFYRWHYEHIRPDEKLFPVLAPGESYEFFPNIVLFRYLGSHFQFHAHFSSISHAWSDVLTKGEYWIRFRYCQESSYSERLFADNIKIWTGKVLTDFVPILLF